MTYISYTLFNIH
ncbi:hypothetical protein F383_20920 [Gossypium arboreum]|uniref:Uncharacterized protein n=1 Tax=Gossypium arboreum TaxID=29729 RepID=A0A0B0NSC0_GOSAR|nr:hypothetical protein F383_20920 [Gossypium arboreum]